MNYTVQLLCIQLTLVVMLVLNSFESQMIIEELRGIKLEISKSD